MKKAKQYGVFTYSLKGENTLLFKDYSVYKKTAIKRGINQAYRDYGNTFTEVWEADKDGLFGRNGLPIWCTRTSGHFNSVINKPKQY